MIDLKELQKQIIENKIKKGFNTTDVNFEFLLTYGELTEAYEAYRKKHDNVGEEIADVVIYLLSICNMLNINLEKELLNKININKNRTYKKVNGVNIKVDNK